MCLSDWPNADARSCEHSNFVAAVTVNRIQDPGQPMRYIADVVIRCGECQEPFRLLGFGAGYSFEGPTVSIDGLVLSAPIEPELVKVLQTKATFQMPPKIPGEG